MSEERLVPRLRFIEETWSSEKLGNLCKITMGQSPSSKNYSKNSNDTILIQGNADLIRGKIVPRIYTSEITKLSYQGDIILTVRAPVGDLAINEFDSCIGRGVCSIKGNKFIYYYLESLKDKHVWERLSQGSTFESINSNDIKNLNLKIPSNSTQNHIINFLTAIDTKIELLQKKHSEYLRFKQYLMQNIFADKSAEKLRFNFTDEWDYLDFNKIFKSVSTKKYQIKSAEIMDNGDFEVIDQGQDEIAGYFNDKNKLCYELPIIIYGDHTTFVKFRDKPFIVGADGVKLLLPKIDANLKYLFYALEYFNIKPEGYKRHFSIIKKINLPLPSLEEQNEISEMFGSVDKKIMYTQKQLKETKKFKKSLLQQMFV